MKHDYPGGYRPLAYCRECGRDFSGDTTFDRHRVGVYAYTYSEGLRMEPLREDGRRCLTVEEMLELGWRPLTGDEMAASGRDRHRARCGVELWADPAERARARRNMAAGALANGADALGAPRTGETPSGPEQLEFAEASAAT